MEENKNLDACARGKTLSEIRNEITALILIDRAFGSGECDALISSYREQGYEPFEAHNPDTPMVCDKYKDTAEGSEPIAYTEDDFVDALDALIENYSYERYDEVRKIGMALYKDKGENAYTAPDASPNGEGVNDNTATAESAESTENGTAGNAGNAGDAQGEDTGTIYIKITEKKNSECCVLAYIKRTAKKVKKFFKGLFD